MRTKINGEMIQRQWLIYSPTACGCVFCIPCKLYSQSAHQLTTGGFSDWKNASARFSDHENSRDHRQCVVLKHATSSAPKAQIDYHPVQQQESERKYWRNVLQRVVVVAVVKFLAERFTAYLL